MHAIVTGSGIDIKNKHQRGCSCFGRPSQSLFIPYYNILSAQPTSSGVRLNYVQPMHPHRLESVITEVRRNRNSLEADNEALNVVDDSSDIFGDRPIVRKRFYVLINPHGGPGKADYLFRKFCKPIFDVAGAECQIHYTTYGGEGRDLAKTTDFSGVDAIVCVSGDGIPYEVLNGLMERNDDTVKRVPVCQLPGGSGNAMAHSLTNGDNFGLNCLNILKGQTLEADLMYITQGSIHSYSFLSQSFGIVADCDLGTEDWRWMGAARFTVGVILKTLSSKKYPCKIAYKRQSPATLPSSTPQYGTVNDEIPQDWSVEVHPDLSMFYVGKMPYMSADALVFPHAKPDDGCMDMVLWDTTIGTIRGLQLLDNMTRGEHINEKDLRYEKVVAYRLMPQGHAYLSVDGEAYDCEPIQVEILSRACLFVSPLGDYPLPKLI